MRLSKKGRWNFIEIYDGWDTNSGQTEKGTTVKNSDATKKQTHEIQFNDFVVESTSRLDVPRILEQLKRISELKIDNYTQLSGSKFESTVKEMFSIIKELEGHLRDVLALNASLREEVQDKRKVREELQREKEAVKQKIAALEQYFPRVQDLERKLEMTIAEVDKFRTLYNLEKEKLAKIEADNRAAASLVDKVREERDDAYREIVVMEDKLKSMTRANQ
jgi:vacuolar-type H+-ATPase subunit I/STV1